MKIVLAVLLLATCCAAQCGVERQKVKTLNDTSASLATNTNNAIAATVLELTTIEAPDRTVLNLLARHNTRYPNEMYTYRVEAAIVGFKLEADEDFHIVIADGPKHTMVVEIPSPNCVNKDYRNTVRDLRTLIETKLGKATKKYKSVPPTAVVVTGVGFFDFIHGQTGVAPNGFELHPVLSLEFP